MRERLSDYYQQRCIITARFSHYSKTDTGSNVVCLKNLYICGKWVADHVWIHRSREIKELALMPGDRVEFEARVCKYVRNTFVVERADMVMDFGLEKIREFKVIERRVEWETNIP